ncbi:MAG TPA: cytochrome c [Parafilimonas sp.]|nr:cytochrome c [Parafilimonas sp.]
MKSKMMIALTSIVIFMVAASFTVLNQQQPWTVPDSFNKKVNPVKADAASINTGKALWAKNCQSCHGKSGKGDGTKAATLDTHPGDFTAAETQGESDGALFYKTMEGRKDMPSFKKKIPDEEDIWALVNYIRTFKK